MKERGKEHPLQTGVLFNRRACTLGIPKIQHRHQHDGRCQGQEVLAMGGKASSSTLRQKKLDLRDFREENAPRTRG